MKRTGKTRGIAGPDEHIDTLGELLTRIRLAWTSGGSIAPGLQPGERKNDRQQCAPDSKNQSARRIRALRPVVTFVSRTL